MATNFLSPCVAVTVAPGTGRPPNLTCPWCSAAARLKTVNNVAAQSCAGQSARPLQNFPTLVFSMVDTAVVYDAIRRETFMNRLNFRRLFQHDPRPEHPPALSSP